MPTRRRPRPPNSTRASPPTNSPSACRALPAIYQGSPIQAAGTHILYLNRQAGLSEHIQRKILDLSQWLNRRHADEISSATAELDSRIAAYELAFRMQSAAPE